MSEARRYQQLRAHFSYLKLDNAAEALPRILEAARAENLSLTAALERLLEIVTWIERTYHRRRRQTALGRLTPVEYEAIMTTPASQAA